MYSQKTQIQVLPIVLVTILSWLLVLFGVNAIADIPVWSRVFMHNFFVLLFFGMVYTSYFRMQKRVNAFAVSIVALSTYCACEVAFWVILYPGQAPYVFSFSDWIFPAFLMTSLVYFFGKLFRT
jgi:hypothetical protein